MSCQERSEERQSHNYEEWQTGDSGRLPHLRHQDIQDWESVESIINELATSEKAEYLQRNSAFFLCTRYEDIMYKIFLDIPKVQS